MKTETPIQFLQSASSALGGKGLFFDNDEEEEGGGERGFIVFLFFTCTDDCSGESGGKATRHRSRGEEQKPLTSHPLTPAADGVLAVDWLLSSNFIVINQNTILFL